MNAEETLARYAVDCSFDDLPDRPVAVAKDVTLAVLGTTIAGARAEGCEALVRRIRDWGGKKEATVLVHGGRVPAHNAAFVNSAMARALDFCDGMVPGLHIGSSAVPTALAAAELAGGCSGKEFLAALVAGSEIASRLNTVSVYDGFDPTGVCGILGATAIAGRILGLDAKQMLHALALAFNRAGGSMQSNIDGSLAVRVIQGFASQSAITCAQLAKDGITGPRNFLEGLYGYFHLYAKDKRDIERVAGDLGRRFEMNAILFKKHPSCGGTLGPTDAMLGLIEERNIAPEDVARVDVTVSPHVFKLVGHPFEPGENSKVAAQFNIRYCVANALLRKSSKLRHFDDDQIRDSRITALAQRVHVEPEQCRDDPASGKFSIGTVVKVTTRNGSVFERAADLPRGHPENPLSQEEHLQRFWDCVEYAGATPPRDNLERVLVTVARLEAAKDVVSLVPLLMKDSKAYARHAKRFRATSLT